MVTECFCALLCVARGPAARGRVFLLGEAARLKSCPDTCVASGWILVADTSANRANPEAAAEQIPRHRASASLGPVTRDGSSERLGLSSAGCLLVGDAGVNCAAPTGAESSLSPSHTSGFACARLRGGLTCGRALWRLNLRCTKLIARKKQVAEKISFNSPFYFRGLKPG